MKKLDALTKLQIAAMAALLVSIGDIVVFLLALYDIREFQCSKNNE